MKQLSLFISAIFICGFDLGAQEAPAKPVAQPTTVATPKLEPLQRQDLTGEGSFHRQGILRQQEAVRETAEKVTPPVATALPSPTPSPSPEPPATP